MTLMLLLSLCVFSQETMTPNMHSTLFGVGTSNVLDTYLSPYNYSGIDVRVVRETMRPTKLMSGHINYQTLLDVDAGYLSNRSSSAHEYAGGIRYSNAWVYMFNRGGEGRALEWGVGLQPSAYLGGIYNTRNGNNPAQLKADIMLNVTAMVRYDVHIMKRVFPFRYQLTVPLVGVAYSPAYGQSYYEEFMLGNYDHNVCFGNFISMPSMRHLFTVDIPIGRNYLRLGWNGVFSQAKLNGLRYHSYSNNFMVGFTKYFYR